MAICGGLEHIIEKPLHENPILLESISPWKHIKSMKTVDQYSFTEIFGQLYLKDAHFHDPFESSSASSSPFSPSSLFSSFSSNSSFSTHSSPPPSAFGEPKSDENGRSGIHQEEKQHKRSDSISSLNSEILSVCTEEVGFDSSDDAEDLLKNDECLNNWPPKEERTTSCMRTEYENYWCESRRRTRRQLGSFPPPISCIGRNGKPWVCFESFRQDGRFILTEIRTPSQEFLHACRKNGRLKMQFIQSEDEFFDEDDDEEEEDLEQNNEDTLKHEDGSVDGSQQVDKNYEWEGVKEEENVKTRSCNVHGSS